MRAQGSDPSSIEHHDLVGIEYCAYPLGDDETRAIFQQLFQGRFDLGFGVNIHGAGAVVQDQDAGLYQQRACYGDALFLPAGEVHASLSNMGLIAIFEPHDELMGLCGLGSRDHLFIGGVGASVADVVADSAAEEHRFLQRDANSGAQGIQGHSTNIYTIDGNPSRCRIVEAGYQVNETRLARSSGTQYRHCLTRLRDQIDVGEDRLIAVSGIAETDIIKDNPSAYVGNSLGIGEILHLRVAIEHFLDATGRGFTSREDSNHHSQHE